MSFADNHGACIHYETEGSGPPLVLQHGSLGSLESWSEYGYIDALKDDYLVVSLDACGHGASGRGASGRTL